VTCWTNIRGLGARGKRFGGKSKRLEVRGMLVRVDGGKLSKARGVLAGHKRRHDDSKSAERQKHRLFSIVRSDDDLVVMVAVPVLQLEEIKHGLL
jgi:hypothetical protein